MDVFFLALLWSFTAPLYSIAEFSTFQFVNEYDHELTIMIEGETIYHGALEFFPEGLQVELTKFEVDQPLLEVEFTCLKQKLLLTKDPLSCIYLELYATEF